LQDIQFHPVSDKILHVDFYQLSDDKEVNMEIPVIIQGSAPGVMLEGGTLVISKRKLKVRALPKNLPDFINVDISSLKLGNKITTAELESEDFTILHPDNTVVCKVRTSRASMSIEEEELEGEATEEGGEATAEGESSSGEE
jgi:large subunit ribosomal protein L25